MKLKRVCIALILLITFAVLSPARNLTSVYNWIAGLLKKKPKSVLEQLEYSIPCLSPLSQDPDKLLKQNEGYFKKAVKEGPVFVCLSDNTGSDLTVAASDQNMNFFLEKSEVNDNLQQMLLVPANEGVLPRRGGMRLHHYTHYEDLTLRDWERYVLTNADPLGIKCGDSVFEVGVGSGAFVQVLQHHYDAKTSGIDLAKPLIDLATRALTGAVLSAKCTPRRTTLIAILRFCLFLHVYIQARIVLQVRAAGCLSFRMVCLTMLFRMLSSCTSMARL